MFLRLNKHLIPGLNKVLVGLHDELKEERKANADAAVAAKNSVSGDRSSPVYFCRRLMASRGFCVLRAAIVVQHHLHVDYCFFSSLCVSGSRH